MLLYNMKTLDFDLVVNKMPELYNLSNYGILLDNNIICKIETMGILYAMKELFNKTTSDTIKDNIVKLYNTLMI